MTKNFSYIEKNLHKKKKKINNAKLRRDIRHTGEVRLMAVTKTVPVEKINFAVSRGINLIGENRVNEFLGKYDDLVKDNLEIHFIGNLQTNKVKHIIDKVDLIQSVDSIKLAEEINKRANLKNKIMDILIEINIGGEENKIGISPDSCFEFINVIKDFKNIKVRGLMTIPPFEASLNKPEIRKYFNEMREIYDSVDIDIGMDILSMGMSEDFEEAIECGADIIRIGTRIFGERK
jgi:pyridoxal phosphate enzyme (YggS family)